jgi:S1-C subfamily serine protease
VAVVALALSIVSLAVGASGGTTRVERTPEIVSSKGDGLDATAIYRQDAPGVAYVQSSGITTRTPFGSSQETATGSGFVFDGRGDILTNAHVVDGAKRATVRFGDSGSEAPARVVGTDNSKDLAVLRVDPSAVPLNSLPLGDSTQMQVGDPVAAIGNPFGFDRTITTGIVSAVQRQIAAPDGFTIDHVIQTDAAINPGNSGGPLINARGQVIGINSQIATGGSGHANVGIGFAIPIQTAKNELPQLENGATIKHAFLGVQVTTGRGGALVRSVEPKSPAAKAGPTARRPHRHARRTHHQRPRHPRPDHGRPPTRPDHHAHLLAQRHPPHHPSTTRRPTQPNLARQRRSLSEGSIELPADPRHGPGPGTLHHGGADRFWTGAKAWAPRAPAEPRVPRARPPGRARLAAAAPSRSP